MDKYSNALRQIIVERIEMVQRLSVVEAATRSQEITALRRFNKFKQTDKNLILTFAEENN